MKAFVKDIQKRLKKLEVRGKELQAKGLKIQQQIKRYQDQYGDLMNQFVANEGAVKEFKEMLKEYDQEDQPNA